MFHRGSVLEIRIESQEKRLAGSGKPKASRHLQIPLQRLEVLKEDQSQPPLFLGEHNRRCWLRDHNEVFFRPRL